MAAVDSGNESAEGGRNGNGPGPRKSSPPSTVNTLAFGFGGVLRSLAKLAVLSDCSLVSSDLELLAGGESKERTGGDRTCSRRTKKLVRHDPHDRSLLIEGRVGDGGGRDHTDCGLQCCR